MSVCLDEAQCEISTLDYFRALGYGPSIAPDGDAPERADYGQGVLLPRLRDALRRINPDMPDEVIEDAIRQVTRTDSPDLIVNNLAFHRMQRDILLPKLMTDKIEIPAAEAVAEGVP